MIGVHGESDMSENMDQWRVLCDELCFACVKVDNA